MTSGNPETEREPSPQELNFQLLRVLERLPDGKGRREAVSQMYSLFGEKILGGPLPEEDLFYNTDRLTEAVDTVAGEVNSDSQRREQSEYKEALMGKFTELMKKAKTTQACKDSLTETLGDLCDNGADPDRIEFKGLSLPGEMGQFNQIFNDLYYNPDSGGIFDEQSVFALECLIYGNATRDHNLLSAAVEEQQVIAKAFGGEPNAKDMEILRFRAFVYAIPISKDATSLENVTEVGARNLENWASEIKDHYGREVTEELMIPKWKAQ